MTEDGLKIDFDDSWVQIRPSNTEPIVRVYTEMCIRDRRQVLDLHGVTCQIADPIASEIRDYLNDYCLARWEEYPYYDQRAHEGVMRTLLIRTTTLGGLMVLIAFAAVSYTHLDVYKRQATYLTRAPLERLLLWL